VNQWQANQVQEGFFKRHKLSFRHRIEGSERTIQGIARILGLGSGSYGTLSNTFLHPEVCIAQEWTI